MKREEERESKIDTHWDTEKDRGNEGDGINEWH